MSQGVFFICRNPCSLTCPICQCYNTYNLEMHFIELQKVHISDIKKLKRADKWIAYFSPKCKKAINTVVLPFYC